MSPNRSGTLLRCATALVLVMWAAAARSATADQRLNEGNQPLRVLIDWHRAHPIADQIDITHRAGGVERTESLTVAIRPPHDVYLEFGPYVVRMTDRMVRVIHQQDMKGYFERPVSADGPLATLAELFPPMPAPQLALALAPVDNPITLTPYCRGVAWSPPIERAVSGKLRREWSGFSSRVQASLHAENDRFHRLHIRTEDGVELEVVATQIPGFDFNKRMESELGRRVQVASIFELRPREGDSGPGSPLPPIPLIASVVDQSTITPSGPCVILFFDRIDEALLIARDALQNVRMQRPTIEVWPTLVTDILESRLSFRLDEGVQTFEPAEVYFTLSPSTTVERFTEKSRSVLVIVDAQSIVRDVVDLTEPQWQVVDGQGEAARTARIRGLTLRIFDALRGASESP